MRTLDFLGLDESRLQGVTDGLAQLLADLQVYYTNLRNFHWNVKGHRFFTMHAKFEEFYNDPVSNPGLLQTGLGQPSLSEPQHRPHPTSRVKGKVS